MRWNVVKLYYVVPFTDYIACCPPTLTVLLHSMCYWERVEWYRSWIQQNPKLSQDETLVIRKQELFSRQDKFTKCKLSELDQVWFNNFAAWTIPELHKHFLSAKPSVFVVDWRKQSNGNRPCLRARWRSMVINFWGAYDWWSGHLDQYRSHIHDVEENSAAL